MSTIARTNKQPADSVKLPASGSSLGEKIAQCLKDNPDYMRALGKLQESVSNSDSYAEYKGKVLTQNAFNIIKANPEAAYLFVNPRTNKAYEEKAQESIIYSGKKESLFKPGIALSDILEKGIIRSNLMFLANGSLYHEILEEGREKGRVLTEQRNQAEIDRKQEMAELSREIDKNREPWQQSPHTRERRNKEVQLALAGSTRENPNYTVSVAEPLVTRYEQAIKDSPHLFDSSDPIPKAVGAFLEKNVRNLAGIQRDPNIKGTAKTNLETNLKSARSRLESFKGAFVPGNQRENESSNSKPFPVIREQSAATQAVKVPPQKVAKPIPEVVRPVPEKVIKEAYFVTTDRKQIREVFIDKNHSGSPSRVKVPMDLEVDGKAFNLTDDISIKRVASGSSTKYRYNLIFHNQGNYQIGGAIVDFGTNFGPKNFNIQENAIVQSRPLRSPEAARPQASSNQQKSPAVPKERTIVKQDPTRVLVPNSVPVNPIPSPMPAAIANQNKTIDQRLMELNSKVSFLDQHKHFLPTEKASQWYWYIDAQQKEIQRLKVNGDIAQLETSILKTNKNLDEINNYLHNYAKTKAVGYQVHEVVEFDAYGRQIKMLDVYWSANNVQSMQSYNANYESFYTQQGNIASRHRTFAGGWASYCNQNQESITFYSHNFGYKGLIFK